MVDKSEKEDEISSHISASWYGDTNSCWRLFQFPLNEMKPSVQKLAIHLEGQQSITYDPNTVTTREELHRVMESQERTSLTAFFELNRLYPEANQYLYCDILQNFADLGGIL